MAMNYLLTDICWRTVAVEYCSQPKQ